MGWYSRISTPASSSAPQLARERSRTAAESMCSRDEGHWKDSDEYAIRSMAQTRATSRALASVLRLVVSLAGFSGTPAEEMGGRGYSGGGEKAASKKQIDYASNLIEKAKFRRGGNNGCGR